MDAKQIEQMTVKEFMEWFVSQYDGYFLPSEIEPCIHRLEGFTLAKDGSEEHALLYASLQNLRAFKTLLEQLKRSSWRQTS